LRIAYQGEPGAYSEEAVAALFPDGDPVGYPTFRLAFDALVSGEVDSAVLPVENSSAGVVQEVSDQLWERPGLRVSREHIQPVRHCLLGWEGTDVVRVISHPQALAQCDSWLHERGIQPVAFPDTAGAARRVAEQREPGVAAVASRAAATRYGLAVLAEGIQDNADNQTRFLVIEPGTPVRPAQGGRGTKCSLAMITAHRPGSLAHALDCFARRGVNLTRLDSRPMREAPFQYRFYLDFEVGEPETAEEALLDLEDSSAEVRLFGTYDAAR
jgi:prephenate dehydratase